MTLTEPFLLGFAGADAFWITNSLCGAFSLTAVFGVVARAVSYRKGG